MEAIIGMLVAILVAVIELVAVGTQLVIGVVAFGIELLVTLILHGSSAASAKIEKRRIEASRVSTATAEVDPAPTDASPMDEKERRVRRTLIGLTVVLVAGMFTWSWWNAAVRQRRIESTRQQINRLANQFIAQVQLPNPNLKEGVLPDLDAWGQPCELFVDDWMLATMVVVRSPGDDGREGTLDDLLAVRVARKPIKVLGVNLADFAADAIKKRLLKLWPTQEQLPEKIDLQIEDIPANLAPPEK